MKKFKFIAITFIIFLLNIKCEKSKNDGNNIILGEWRLIEVFGVKTDKTLGWITVPSSPIQKINFSSNGSYTISADGNITCNGNFAFVSNDKLNLNPNSCMPLMQVTETIYKLTSDSLIISNHSNSISSFNLRQDKYIRNN